MKAVVWLLVIALLVLHQDEWFWSDDSLVFGFMPVGLFYHSCLSLAAGGVWWLAVTFAWPAELEEETWAAVETSSNEAEQITASGEEAVS